MSDPKVLSPQLITDSDMVYLCFEAEDQDALRSFAPEGFQAGEPGTVFLNQYWVTDKDKHSNGSHPNGWGAYSLTYMGVELVGHDLHDGTPCRWWTHYYDSSSRMVEYASDRGIPAASGRTDLDISDDGVVATTYIGEKPVIRSVCKFSDAVSPVISGQLLYLTRKDGQFEKGRYPFVGVTREDFEVRSLEFLDPESPFYGLRPKQPLNITFGFFSPNLTFCYPGGQQKFEETSF